MQLVNQLFIFQIISFSFFGALNAQELDAHEELNLVYTQDFTAENSINDFVFTDKSAWKLSEVEGNPRLELVSQSNYQPIVRSPFNIAILEGLELENFTLEVELAQTGKEYNHRDLCLFFGIVDSSHFYYVHMASVADDHANNIFLVNNEPRIKIASKTTAGTKWGATNSVHKVRITRRADTGLILVYFDDFDQPIMEAKDLHFKRGKIGFGSFDDTGWFDNVKIWKIK